MAGFGSGELIWLVVAALLALGVVITWIMKAESSRKVFRAEVSRLNSQLDELEREKIAMVDEVEAFKNAAGSSVGGTQPNGGGVSSAVAAKMAERVGELEKENANLKSELNEARSSLEEVYKAMCSK